MRYLLVAFALCSSLALADYGWMPKDQNLFLGFGADYLRSASNFSTDGPRTAIRYQGVSSNYSALHFWVEPEYTFTPGWSGRLRLGVASNSTSAVSTGTTSNGSGSNSLLSGGGISEILLGIKWRLSGAGQPSLVLEPTVKFPTNSNYVNAIDANTKLLAGDGSVDLGLALHAGYRKKHLLIAISPQFLMRTSSYAPAVFVRGAAGASFAGGYVLATTDYYASLGSNLLFDTSPSVHDAAGTGGSYALLSGSPSLFTFGVKGGVRVSKTAFVEATFRQAVWGIRAPYFFQFGLNGILTFDFKKPDPRVKAHEIPFDSEPETNPDGTYLESPSEK